MANGNFSIENSKVATCINNLSSKELFNRYFVPGKKSEWEADTNEVINTLSNNDYAYPLTVSLQGKLLNALLTKFAMKLAPYIPDDYKLNASNIFSDIENLFAENRNEVRKSVFSNQYTDDTKNRILFVLDSCNRGLEYILSNKVD